MNDNCNRGWWVADGPNPYGALQSRSSHQLHQGDRVVRRRGVPKGHLHGRYRSQFHRMLLPEHGPFRVAVLFSPFAFVQSVNQLETMNDINTMTEMEAYC